MQEASRLREFDSDEIRCDPGNSEIGSGNYGNVVLGHHESFDALAIKIFKICGGKIDKQLITKRFDKEIGHLQKANHENIVRVFGHVKWPYALGIVMEYCPAGNLMQCMRNHDIPVEISLSIRMLTDVASAIAFIHNLFDDKRLIHLDVKPENILLTVELRCKVGDLGSAEVITLSGLTTTTAIGTKCIPAITPLYTPPERLRDMSILPSKEHDIYGYGIVTYVVCARAHPYPSGELTAILESIKNGTRPNLSLVKKRLQNLDGRDRASLVHVAKLMEKCWDQNPQERPNMTDVKSSMSQLLLQQDRSAIRNQVELALQKMKINDSIPQNPDRLVPLHCFNTNTNRFQQPEQLPFNNRVAVEQETDESPLVRQTEEPGLRRRRQRNSQQNLQAQTRPKPTSKPSHNHGRQAVVVSALALCLIGFLMLLISTTPKPLQVTQAIAGVFGDNEKVAILAEAHSTSLTQHGYEEASLKHDLLLKLVGRRTNTKAKQVKELADQLENSKHYLEAILFYEISLNLFVKHPVGEASASGFASCLLSLKKACEHMIEYEGMAPLQGKLNIAEQYVLPRLKRGVKQLNNFQSVPEFLLSMRLLDCGNAVGQLVGLVAKYQHKLVLVDIDKTVKYVEEQHARLGPDVYKQWEYSDLLNKIGRTFEKISLLDKAVDFYTQAVGAIKQAEDASEASKKKLLDKYEKNLQRVKKLFK